MIRNFHFCVNKIQRLICVCTTTLPRNNTNYVEFEVPLCRKFLKVESDTTQHPVCAKMSINCFAPMSTGGGSGTRFAHGLVAEHTKINIQLRFRKSVVAFMRAELNYSCRDGVKARSLWPPGADLVEGEGGEGGSQEVLADPLIFCISSSYMQANTIYIFFYLSTFQTLIFTNIQLTCAISSFDIVIGDSPVDMLAGVSTVDTLAGDSTGVSRLVLT